MKGPKNNKKKAPSPGRLALPGMDVEQIETLLDFMAAHGLEEFEYDHGGLHIKLKKAASGANLPSRGSASQSPALSAPPVPANPGSATAAEAAPASSAPASIPHAEELHVIKSPIVGTFYASPSPEAGPFVRVGSPIEVGRVVCIIEAMKLMNEIEADVSGEVVQALVENGQPVEYGQGLFAIRPAKKKK